ncbi:DnaJ domain-containing protein [Roridomyces roridus]|uniref:DnaJ domain-containing protein n=1 Tax=Roridomyces roridus TaxID=1738132 RepID=A0AAD7CGP9_9AGAR|nr:DnaJ domain-containing protein [Roridomyces roridus]
MHRRALSTTGCRRGTHYDTLGVSRHATTAQVKKAFFSLSKEHHPDVPDHKEKPPFHAITEAYNILRDPVSRRAYDNTLPAPQAPSPSTLQSRHLADTAARLRRTARASSSSSSSSPPPFAPRTHHGAHEPPFRRRPPTHVLLPGANNLRHNLHPGQRYQPPDPAEQAAAWAAQQEMLREKKTRGTRFMGSMMVGFSMLVVAGWAVDRMLS